MRHPIPHLFLTSLLIFIAPVWAGDASSKIISVSTTSITVGKKHPKTYKITPATTVVVNGAKARVDALKQGMEATVSATADTATNIDVQDEAPKKSKN